MAMENSTITPLDLKTKSAPDFSGKWQNTLDAEMELFVDKDGNLSGKYRTEITDPTKSKEYELTGFSSGDVITFCVKFRSYRSLASWAGQLTIDQNGDEVITSL